MKFSSAVALRTVSEIKNSFIPFIRVEAEEFKADAVALKDALTIRFSKDPVVMDKVLRSYTDWSMDAHTTLCAEDAERIHRRCQWVTDAFYSRCASLAQRWGLPSLDTGRYANGASFVVPNDPQAESWTYVDHKELEATRSERILSENAEIIRLGKRTAKGLGAFLGLFGLATGLVAMIYLASWLGSIAALFAFGFVIELFV